MSLSVIVVSSRLYYGFAGRVGGCLEVRGALEPVVAFYNELYEWDSGL